MALKQSPLSYRLYGPYGFTLGELKEFKDISSSNTELTEEESDTETVAAHTVKVKQKDSCNAEVLSVLKEVLTAVKDDIKFSI